MRIKLWKPIQIASVILLIIVPLLWILKCHGVISIDTKMNLADIANGIITLTLFILAWLYFQKQYDNKKVIKDRLINHALALIERINVKEQLIKEGTISKAQRTKIYKFYEVITSETESLRKISQIYKMDIGDNYQNLVAQVLDAKRKSQSDELDDLNYSHLNVTNINKSLGKFELEIHAIINKILES